MKRLLILVALCLCATNLYGQVRIDTLYYTKEWKQAPNRAFSDFYRVTYYPTDSLKTKQFRDYYISGRLQGKGNFIKIDSLDDANTIFDGQRISYYHNGEPEFIRTYQQGVLNGEFYIYKEDGHIKHSGTYLNGKLSGLCTEFIDDNTYSQVEYLNGIPVNDYYVIVDSDGNVTKFLISDNSPIWETPSTAERKTEYKDGTLWQFYYKNGVTIALTSTIIRDYGKWHCVDIIISNNTIIPIEFNPTINITASSTDSKGCTTSLAVWSSDKYLKRVKRIQRLALALTSFAEGMSASKAGRSSSTTYYSGSSYSYGSGRYHTGSSISHTHTYNAGAAYQARILAQQRIENLSNDLTNEREIKELGYLKKNTIYPGESISGYVHIKRIKGKTAQFIIDIEGAKYIFDWSIEAKKKR